MNLSGINSASQSLQVLSLGLLNLPPELVKLILRNLPGSTRILLPWVCRRMRVICGELQPEIKTSNVAWQILLTTAASNGYVNILEWARLNQGPYLKNFKKEYQTLLLLAECQLVAARCGQISVLQWSLAHFDFLSPSIANAGAVHGHVEVLDWVKQHVIDQSKIWCDVSTNAAGCGHLHVLQWFKEKGVPLDKSSEICDQAAWDGQLDVLIWLKANGIWDSESVYKAALRRNRPHVLKWWEDSILADMQKRREESPFRSAP